VLINGSIIQRNEPGAIRLRGCVALIQKTRLCHNTGEDGVVISSSYSGEWPDVVFGKTSIISCELGYNDATPISFGNDQLFLSGCVIHHNSKAPVECYEGDALIENCVIRDNSSSGSVLDLEDGEYRVSRCVIANNRATGPVINAIFNSYSWHQMIRVTIGETTLSDNISGDHMTIYYTERNWGPCLTAKTYDPPQSYLLIRGSTIADNCISGGTANDRYIIFNDKPRYYDILPLHIENSLIYGNDGDLLLHDRPQDSSIHFQVNNCCLQEEFEGEGNFVADPMFASGPLGDYYLSSTAAGQHTDSLCIDAGSTSASIAGANWCTTRTDGAFDTGLVDIGYHYAATPPTIEPSVGGAGGAVAAGADEAPVLGPGDVLRAQITVANEGWPIWVDFYAAFVAADGTVFYITPDGLTTDFTPYAIDILLDDGLHFGPASVFEFVLNEHVAPGDYVFAAALSRAREPFRPIGPITFSRFRIM